MELKQQFGDFLKDIRPSDKQKEDWKTGSKTLRTRLLNDETLSPHIVGTFLQGSVRRSTAVRPTGGSRPDVDVVIVTTIDHTKETPAVAMKRFEPFLEKHYKGKWERQDRSFGIELSYVDLDLVVTALPSSGADARSSLQEIYKSESVQTVESLEDQSDWQLDKAWKPGQPLTALSKALLEAAEGKDWKSNPLMLPDRKVSDWGPTHPLAQIDWTAKKNRRCNGHYVNIVRAVKWWRHHHIDNLPKYPKGYPLEHLIGSVLPDGTESMAKGVTSAFEQIRDRFQSNVLAGTVPDLRDHGVPTHDVMKRVSAKDFREFHAGVSKAATIARQALDETDATKSAEFWRQLFGTSFPLPPSGGGDRSTGFSSPSGPADPKFERFA